MYELIYRTSFSAGHHLREYRGKCEQPHGHNWDVIVTLEQTQLDRLGMVIDFHDVKKDVGKVLDNFDHKYLNDLKMFKGKTRLNPTTENIARLIYQILQKRLSRKAIKIKQVSVWESSNCGITYSGNSY